MHYIGVFICYSTLMGIAMEAAYTNAVLNRVNTNTERINLGDDLLGGNFVGADAPLTPGVYTFNTGDVTIGSDITFSGSSTDIFIIQMTGNLVQAGNMNVIVGHVSVGAGADMEGILLVKTHGLFDRFLPEWPRLVAGVQPPECNYHRAGRLSECDRLKLAMVGRGSRPTSLIAESKATQRTEKKNRNSLRRRLEKWYSTRVHY
jgi:hypothetical protein